MQLLPIIYRERNNGNESNGNLNFRSFRNKPVAVAAATPQQTRSIQFPVWISLLFQDRFPHRQASCRKYRRIDRQDQWGTIKARLGAGRMNYAIDPGLYALGEPDDQSPVLVTANYKMSFDYLRQALRAETPGFWFWTPRESTSGARREKEHSEHRNSSTE